MSPPSPTGAGPAAPRNLGGTELKRLHRDWRRRTEGRLGLLLDGVQNPFNLGAILRTAAAFSVDHLWLAGAPSPTDPSAEDRPRVATVLHVDRPRDLDRRRRRGPGRRVPHHRRGAGRRRVALHELDLSGAVCLALGHEDRGLSKELLPACDALGYIPQLGRIGSLNVGTATAIACYEARRTAWTSDSPT